MLLLAATCAVEPFLAGSARTLTDAVINELEAGEPVLLPAWLSQISGSIVVEADSIEVGDLELNSVRLPISLKADRIEVNDGRAESGIGEVRLDADYVFSNNDIRLRIGGNRLSFDDDDPRDPDGPIFGLDVFVPDWVRAVDGQLMLDLDVVAINEMEFRSILGPVMFTDHGIKADIEGTLGSGSLVVSLNHTYNDNRTSIAAKGSGISLGIMRAARGYVEGADTSFEMNVVGEGISPRAFVSTMRGHLEAEVGPGLLNNTHVDKLAQNVFALPLSTLSPFRKARRQANIECAALRFDFRDGRSETAHGIVIRTDRLVVMGRGVLDLDRETLDLHFKPYVRQGIKTKTGGVVSLISVLGPMRAPKLKLKKAGLLTEGVSLGTAFMTFGLSKVGEAVFDWATKSDIACEIAVDE